MIRKETKYITEDGEKFDTLGAAEAWESAKNKGQERELRKKIYKNLYEFLFVSNLNCHADDLLEYLVKNKKRNSFAINRRQFTYRISA